MYTRLAYIRRKRRKTTGSYNELQITQMKQISDNEIQRHKCQLGQIPTDKQESYL